MTESAMTLTGGMDNQGTLRPLRQDVFGMSRSEAPTTQLSRQLPAAIATDRFGAPCGSTRPAAILMRIGTPLT